MSRSEMMNSPSNGQIKAEYFQWLCYQVDIPRLEESYYILAKVLFEKPFVWFVPNDDNRAEDGILLRQDFCDDCSYYEYPFEDTCNCFEMLVALAKRCDFEIANPYTAPRVASWFWEMLDNLGLTKYTDDEWYRTGGSPGIVDQKLNIWLQRRYKKNGEGDTFPLQYPKKDQRNVEIWYQMCSYLEENYPT